MLRVRKMFKPTQPRTKPLLNLRRLRELRMVRNGTLTAYPFSPLRITMSCGFVLYSSHSYALCTRQRPKIFRLTMAKTRPRVKMRYVAISDWSFLFLAPLFLQMPLSDWSFLFLAPPFLQMQLSDWSFPFCPYSSWRRRRRGQGRRCDMDWFLDDSQSAIGQSLDGTPEL